MPVCTSSRISFQPQRRQAAVSRSQNACDGMWIPPSPSTGSIRTPGDLLRLDLVDEQPLLDEVHVEGVVVRAGSAVERRAELRCGYGANTSPPTYAELLLFTSARSDDTLAVR